MASFDFLTVDVFTARPFGGNPLAIIPDARGLDRTTMQAIATEFNLSETVFLLPPPDGSEAIATVRIFTPANELPFAGHPNVGAAFHVASAGSIFGREAGNSFQFDEKAGPVRCTIDRGGGAIVASIAAPKPLRLIEDVDSELIARCASLSVEAIATARHRPVLASVGLPFVLVELASLDALAAAQPDRASFQQANSAHPRAEDHFNLNLYVRDADDPSRIRSRMFAPLVGVTEDPATGSAAACLGALQHRLDGECEPQTYAITQGVEMGRRSDMVVRASNDGVTVGGPCVPIQRGTLSL